MCFSATASFIGAGVVGAAGIGTLAMVRRPREIAFASVPLIFAVHQALEGLTWVALNNNPSGQLTGCGVHGWVFIAWAFLPAFIPWAVWLMEPDPVRRKWMWIPMVVGWATGAFMMIQVFRPDIYVQIVGNNLDYHMGPGGSVWVLPPYIFATCVAPMMSSYVYTIVMGAANVVALTTAAIMRAADFSSLWCTFAAFISIIIFVHFLDARRSGKERRVKPWKEHRKQVP
ncbi:MAG: DUF6629 family protein [Scrofimicrobium sp.]